MERFRFIYPELWRDKTIAQYDPLTALLFIAIQNFSDDLGVIPATKHWIKETIFRGWKSVSIQKITKALKNLTELKKIIPFSYSGDDYFYIVDFKRYQKIDKRWAKFYVKPSEIEQIITSELTKLEMLDVVQERFSGCLPAECFSELIAEPSCEQLASNHDDATRLQNNHNNKKKNKNRGGRREDQNSPPLPSFSSFNQDRFREIYEKYPMFKIHERFSEILADQIEDMEAWEQTVSYWAEKGYNTENIEAMLHRYHKIVYYKNNPGIAENTEFFNQQGAFTEEERREWEKLNGN